MTAATMRAGAVALLAAALLTTTAGCRLPDSPAASTGDSPVAESAGAAGDAADQLAQLRTAPAGSMRGYRRDQFGAGWTHQRGQCSTRVLVLVRQGEGVQVRGHCTVVGGVWHSLYDGITVRRAGLLDIDHLVPLAEAWRSGAAAWSPARRVQLANDVDRELVAVTRHSNRTKGDEAPPAWMPVPADRCAYARGWVGVKAAYGLSVTGSERAALTGMLGTCGRSR